MCTVSLSPSKRATVACGSRQACDCVPVRKVCSTSSGFPEALASESQLRALPALLENAEDGPRRLPFQAAGAGAPSETLPAFLRLAFSNTIGASFLRAASSPITDGRRSLENVIAAIAASAVLRSQAATAAIGWPT